MSFIGDELWKRIRRLQGTSEELTEIVRQLVETEAESHSKKRRLVCEECGKALEDSGE